MRQKYVRIGGLFLFLLSFLGGVVNVHIAKAANTNSISFDGNDWVAVPNNSGYSLTTAFTIEAWFKATALPNNGGMATVIGKGANSDGGNGEHNFYAGISNNNQGVSGTKLVGGFEDTAGVNYIVTPSWDVTAAQLNQWHHIAVTWNNAADTLTLYYDGVQAGQTTGITATPASNPNGIVFGKFTPTANNHFFTGRIDDVRIWNYARSASEISSNYATELTTPLTGLLGYWGFSEGTGTTSVNLGSLQPGTAGLNGATWSTDVPFTSAPTTPAAPTNLVATGGNTVVNLTWTASSGATSYTVKRSTASGSGYVALTPSTSTTSFSDTTVTNGTTYYYVVTATNVAGESGNSVEANAIPQLPPPPAAPTNLNATASSHQVVLTWTASSGAASYAVKRSTTSGSGYSVVNGNVTNTNFTDTNLTNGTTYYYVVSASNANGESLNSAEANATPQAQPPAAPTNLAATGGNAVVNLTWMASSGATSYTVLRSETSGSGYVALSPTTTSLNYSDTTVINGTTYYYVVRATNADGDSGDSNEASTTPQINLPGAPTNLSATGGNAVVNLTWTASSGATSYKVYRSTTSGSGYVALSPTTTSTNFADTTVTNGTTYYYVVRALNVDGESGDSNEASATPQVGAPAAPTNLVATPGNGVVTLTWTASAGATSYTVKRSTTSGTGYVSLTPNPTATNFSDTTVTNGTTYYYVVVANNAGGTSGNSNQATATPQVPPTGPVPVLSYTFEDNDQVVSDSSGYGHGAVLGLNSGTEATDPTYETGRTGQGLRFDGVDDRLTVNAASTLDNFQMFAFEAWLYPEDFVDSQEGYAPSYIYSKGNNDKVMYFNQAGGTLAFEIKKSGNPATEFTTIAPIPKNQWTHVVMTGQTNNGALRIYYNGVQVGTAVGKFNNNASTSDASTSWQLGSNNGTRNFHGKMDNVRIYNTALSQTDITNLFNAGMAGDATAPTVTIASPGPNTELTGHRVFYATVSDETAFCGVQFKLNNVNVGSEDKFAPYAVKLDTRTKADGAYTLAAVARDCANHTTTTSIPVTIKNTNPSPDNRPDIIVMMTDDQAKQTAEYETMGLGINSMPLASAVFSQNSVRFSNAFASNPLCCPSRSTFLTGNYSHNHHVFEKNSGDWLDDSSLLPIWMQQAGYRTGLFGKYLNGYHFEGTYIPPGWNEWFGMQKNVHIGYYNWGANDNGNIVNYGTAPSAYGVVVLRDKAINFINTTPANQKLFMFWTPITPHATEPDDVIPAYPTDIGFANNMPNWRPPNFNEQDLSDKPQWMQNRGTMTQARIDQFDAAHRSHVDALQSVDRAINDIVQAMTAAGRTNFVLVYMSDHGLTWGENGSNGKNLPYDGSAGIHMWVRAPGVTNRTETGLMSNVSIAATVADYANATIPYIPDGQSIRARLENPNVPGPEGILIESANIEVEPIGYSAIRTLQYLYTEWTTGERELYDLAVDPYQMQSQHNNPAYNGIKADLATQLAALKAE